MSIIFVELFILVFPIPLWSIFKSCFPGRGGRDGLPACSTIYYNSYDLAPSQNLSAHMNDLVKADKCKREIILNYFGYKSPM